MSISLLVEYPNAENSAKLIPVATADEFRNYWKPAIQALSLKWVPLFESGLPLEQPDIPCIISELHMLSNFVSDDCRANLPASAVVRIRVDV